MLFRPNLLPTCRPPTSFRLLVAGLAIAAGCAGPTTSTNPPPTVARSQVPRPPTPTAPMPLATAGPTAIASAAAPPASPAPTVPPPDDPLDRANFITMSGDGTVFLLATRPGRSANASAKSEFVVVNHMMKPLARFPSDDCNVSSATLSHSGMRVAARCGSGVTIWDAPSKSVVIRIAGAFSHLVYETKGTHLYALDGGGTTIVKIDGAGNPIAKAKLPPSSSGSATHLAALSQHGAAIGRDNGTILVLDEKLRSARTMLVQDSAYATSQLAWSLDGKHVASLNRGGHLQVFDVQTRKRVLWLKGTDGGGPLVFSADGGRVRLRLAKDRHSLVGVGIESGRVEHTRRAWSQIWLTTDGLHALERRFRRGKQRFERQLLAP